ncbi:MAG: anthranilate phosphoribosyltransferase [Synechococcales cyanobacterium]
MSTTDTTQLWPLLLHQLLERQSLSEDQAELLMNAWLDSEVPEVLSGAILAALQAKGVTASELAGMARVLQRAAVGERLTAFPVLIDTCGTGGDGAGTFNISTAVAFVVSAAGIPVAKHGNRSASSKVGSADVLEALGVNLAATPDQIRAAVSEVGITFLFAPHWHPAMRAVMSIRKTLKVRTIFNLLGPLVNPLGPNRQVVGVYDSGLVPTVAAALGLLGCERAIVLHSREGMDEAGLEQPTDLGVLQHGEVTTRSILAADVDLTPAPRQALQGGELADNVAIMQAVLQGGGTPAQRDAVILNSALALHVAGDTPDWETFPNSIAQARAILSSGLAWEKLQKLIAFLHA